jgi:hypothetical protein
MSEASLILSSTITCPACGVAKAETMPVDACLFFYTCTGCGTRLRPKPGDCCVFCSYGSVPCPPVQSLGRGASCCEETAPRASAAPAAGERVVLRPGVDWPMWSCAIDPTARRALEAGLAASRWLEKWAGLDTQEDRAWRAILLGFARTGRTQSIASLAAATGLEAAAVVTSLRGLRRRDMIVLDDATLSVSAAYPFCAWVTEHHVEIAGGETVHSLCAIDALGAGAMLGCDTVIESLCRFCGASIRIATRDGGRAIGSVSPSTATVWSGLRYAGNCSATSGCTLKAFFCSQEHRDAWRARDDRDGVGFALTLEAAQQMGLALFQPLLMPERAAESGRTAL